MAGSAVDEIAVPLARGERPPVWGLNLNVFPQGQADLAVPFAAWVSQAAPLLSPFGCYLYDTQFLHVTASSPAPFTNGASLSTWVEEEKGKAADGAFGSEAIGAASLVLGARRGLLAVCGAPPCFWPLSMF